MLDDGKRRSAEEKRSISSTPVTNSGIEIPTKLVMLTRWSSFVSGRTPAHMPAATAVGVPTRSAKTARIAEFHSFLGRISLIG
ncbi:hypothetical protein ES703_105274 [subsurface metagenome]